MNYRITKKTIGSRNFSKLCELSTDSVVLDTCFLKDNGILYIEDGIGCISCLSLSGKSSIWNGNKDEPFIQNGSVNMARVKSPRAICHNGDVGYLIEDGGSIIRKVGLKYRGIESFTGKFYTSVFEKYSDISKKSKIDCSASKKYMVFSVDKLNRLFFVSKGKLTNIYGDGKSRFKFSNVVNKSSFNSPSGVCIKDGEIYISDKGNNCIRKISKDHKSLSVIAGDPVRESCLSAPSRIRCINGMVLVHDDNKIKITNSHGFDTVFESDKIESFVLNGYDLYIWEKLNERI